MSYVPDFAGFVKVYEYEPKPCCTAGPNLDCFDAQDMR